MSRDPLSERIESHSGLIEHVVDRLMLSLPSHIDKDELMMAGTLALVEAASRFEPRRNTSFATFANRRIERSVMEAARSARGDSAQADSRHSDPISLDSTAPNESHGRQSFGRLDQLAGGSSLDPVELLEEREQAAYIRSAIQYLPERHRLVTIAYFLEGKTLEEIGDLLDVTPSRVSQIKEDSLRRIREGLAAQYADPSTETRSRRRAPARDAYAARIAAASQRQRQHH